MPKDNSNVDSPPSLEDISLDDSTDSEVNFIKGDQTSEELVGTNKDDDIVGYAGDDDLYGEKGNDLLIGVDFTNFGAGEIDILTGGAGEDIFSLGTEEQAFYVEEGAEDFAIISDYSLKEGDVIIAYGSAKDYELIPLEDDNNNAVGIFYKGEAISVVEDNLDLDLSTDFLFWDETSDA
jgi:Ca2+-binding RTX toxin-like protein